MKCAKRTSTRQGDPNSILGTPPMNAATKRLLRLVPGLLGPKRGGSTTGEGVRHVMRGDPEEEDGPARILGLIEGHAIAGVNDIAWQGKNVAPMQIDEHLMPRLWQAMGRIGEVVAPRPVNLGAAPLNSPKHQRCATPYGYMSHIAVKMLSPLPRNTSVVGHYKCVRSKRAQLVKLCTNQLTCRDQLREVASGDVVIVRHHCGLEEPPIPTVSGAAREGKASFKMGVHSSHGRASHSTINRSSRSSKRTPCNTKRQAAYKAWGSVFSAGATFAPEQEPRPRNPQPRKEGIEVALESGQGREHYTGQGW